MHTKMVVHGMKKHVKMQQKMDILIVSSMPVKMVVQNKIDFILLIINLFISNINYGIYNTFKWFTIRVL